MCSIDQGACEIAHFFFLSFSSKFYVIIIFFLYSDYNLYTLAKVDLCLMKIARS